MGCYEVTLNVWAGNTSAEKFYKKLGMKTKKGRWNISWNIDALYSIFEKSICEITEISDG